MSIIECWVAKRAWHDEPLVLADAGNQLLRLSGWFRKLMGLLLMQASESGIAVIATALAAKLLRVLLLG